MNSFSIPRFTYSNLSVLTIFAVSAAFAWVWVEPIDDALITHRYVENFRSGLGPYFNPGDETFGVSSPGYFLLLALTSIVVPIEVGYKVIAVCGYFFIGLLMVNLIVSKISESTISKTWHFVFPIGIALIYALNFHFAYWTFSGMETWIIPLFFLLIVRFALNRTFVIAIGCVVVATVFRPEAVFALIPALSILAWRDSGRSVLRTVISAPRSEYLVLAASIALVTVIVAFIWNISGSPIPTSILAKMSLGHESILSIGEIEKAYSAFVAPIDLPVNFGLVYAFGALVVTAYLFMVASKYSANSTVHFSYISALSIFSIYLMLTHAFIWPWHVAFVSFGLTFAISSTLVTLLNKSHRSSFEWQMTLIAVPVITVMLGIASLADGNATNQRISEFYIGQMEQAGRLLANTLDAGDTVVVGSSGYFGMVTPELRVIDDAGLWTKEIIQARRQGNTQPSFELVEWSAVVCKITSANCQQLAEQNRVIDSSADLLIIVRS